MSRALKEGGAPHETWEPLVDRALAMLGARRDLVWARLVLLQDRYSEITNGVANVVQWVGQDVEAVAVARSLARSLGDEDDWARTLDPLDWRTRSETEAAWTVVRSWTRPSAILHGLNAVARDLFYRARRLRGRRGSLPRPSGRRSQVWHAAQSGGGARAAQREPFGARRIR